MTRGQRRLHAIAWWLLLPLLALVLALALSRRNATHATYFAGPPTEARQ